MLTHIVTFCNKKRVIKSYNQVLLLLFLNHEVFYSLWTSLSLSLHL